jgi:cytochrome c-type biogenesis protein CcmH
LFLQALAKDPDNPQARFYLGLAQAQIGAFEKAVAIWRDLETSSPANAPWLPTLRQHIADVARQGGFDATAITPAAPSPPGNGAEAAAAPAMPGGAAAAAIAQQSPADQAKTIRAMVDGLATRLQSQPDDYDGWMRLAKSYKVLGERDKAIAAARHAIGLRPTEIEPRLALAQIQLGDATDTALPGDFLATLKDVLAIDGDDATALYYLGIAAAASHQPAEARRLWQKLLTHLPAEGTERVEVDRRLQALD